MRKQPKRGSSQDGREEHSCSGHASLQALVISNLSGCWGNSHPVIAVRRAEASGKTLRCVAAPFGAWRSVDQARLRWNHWLRSLAKAGVTGFAMAIHCVIPNGGVFQPTEGSRVRDPRLTFLHAGSPLLNNADDWDVAESTTKASPPLPRPPASPAPAPAPSRTPVQTAGQQKPRRPVVHGLINAEYPQEGRAV